MCPTALFHFYQKKKKAKKKSLFKEFIYTYYRCEVFPLTPDQVTEMDDFLQYEQT